MTASTQLSPRTARSNGRALAQAGKYLTFRLAAEEYGLEILKVREIIGLMKMTHIPKSPEYVRGVINLRGKVIPVLDLRLRFGMPSAEDTDQTCIIVVDIKTSDHVLVMGLVVDAVSEVIDVSQNEIEEAPSVGTDSETSFILGIAKIKNEVKILLDIDQVLTQTDFSGLDVLADQPVEMETVPT